MGHLPTTELIIRNGQPLWLVQGDGVEVLHPDGVTAVRLFNQECQHRSLKLPSGGQQPRRGPSECDEPGV
jgi:hypothetical protein